MIQSKHTFNSALETHMLKYIEHKQFYSGFTLNPFTATEHFDIKIQTYNVKSYF